jgi:pilus assembly protein CpaC
MPFMSNLTRKLLKMTPAVVLLFVFMSLPCLVPAAQGDILIQETIESRKLELVAGKSVILKSQRPISRISIADPSIADFLLPTSHEIYIIAKKAGTTNVTFWQNDRVAGIYDLHVVYDLTRLKQQIHEMLPDEKNVMVTSTNDTITLTGKVSSNAALNQVMALARSHVPWEDKNDKDDKINNMLEVGGIHQVMLEVRVAEIGKDTTKRMGINFAYVDDQQRFGVSLLGRLTELVKPDDANIGIDAPLGLAVSPAVNALFRITDGSATWTGFIDALKSDGLAKILAEPTLIALSGQNASFLAGGEFPIPVPQGLGEIAIEYRKFGVSLNFTPTVINDNKIAITVAPEVSELDFSTAVRFSGFVAPGITTRRAATTIELGDGQSFAIAGLLQENISDSISKYPILGDIPVLGTLFRSRAFQKRETELVIVVTPRLVKPVSGPDQIPLPTDYYIEPNDFEIYLTGEMEGRSPQRVSMKHLEGAFGYSVPDLE